MQVEITLKFTIPVSSQIDDLCAVRDAIERLDMKWDYEYRPQVKAKIMEAK